MKACKYKQKTPPHKRRGIDIQVTGYKSLFSFFSNSITTKTITPVAAAMDRSHPLSGMTSKNFANAGTYITINCSTTTEPAPEIPIEEGQEKKVDPHQEVTHFAQFRSELAEV